MDRISGPACAQCHSIGGRCKQAGDINRKTGDFIKSSKTLNERGWLHIPEGFFLDPGNNGGLPRFGHPLQNRQFPFISCNPQNGINALHWCGNKMYRRLFY